MPNSEPERLAEALRGALPELLKLDRYERRAALRRERALRIIQGDASGPNEPSDFDRRECRLPGEIAGIGVRLAKKKG